MLRALNVETNYLRLKGGADVSDLETLLSLVDSFAARFAAIESPAVVEV